ncbi:MAG: 50S ribosomal protein L1 [Omnitrophica WOR_2 bacterium RIFCSPHIGHO2_02_FULL_68_15]|nr:MAG: 50S ribosomal protein L1 [Omnitrophica WOR_2 bacterium RIFCSPHIGHO2_02_FULL_68_15]
MPATLSKRMRATYEAVDRRKAYPVAEAVAQLQQAPKVKFDETVDLAVKLDIDPKQTELAVRGTVVLPHGTGKTRRVIVFAKGDAAKAAETAGADVVGGDELIQKVAGGWLDFDVVVATPDLMKDLSKLGKLLGPRGLMPSPKAGTVTVNVAQAIKEIKLGKVEFKMDKQGDIHLAVGKRSFPAEYLTANIMAFLEALWRVRPAAAKGQYVRAVSVSSTMGPGLRLDLNSIRQAVAA